MVISMDEIYLGATAPMANEDKDTHTQDVIETHVETGPLMWDGEWDKSFLV